MSEPTTLRALSGLPLTPASLADSTLIMIDCQNTYVRGVMALARVAAALDEAAELPERARSAGIPIIHPDGPPAEAKTSMECGALRAAMTVFASQLVVFPRQVVGAR
jgi:nicotinamidase-related amidase